MKNLCTKAVTIFTFLISVSLFATCPDWNETTAYEEGAKISYDGDLYVAQRDVPANTPPATSDNGWFWGVTDEPCNDKVVVTADTYVVKVYNKFTTIVRSFFIDQTGINLKMDHPTGGSATTKVGYDNISIMDSSYRELDETELSSGEIKVRFKNNGTTYEKYTKVTPDGVVILSSPVSAASYGGHEMSLASNMGETKVKPGEMVLHTSFGQTTVSDHGVTTDKGIVSGYVTTDNLTVNGENVLAKIAALEARIAELEAQLQ